MSLIFWGSFWLILYVLLAYPTLMSILGKFLPRRIDRSGNLPTLTIIIAACNEEQHIGDMLEQIEKLDYPSDKLECVVATDDGSTDGTHDILHRAEERGTIRIINPESGQVGKNVSAGLGNGADHR